MSRTTEEWFGATDDTRPPPRVRLRVFAAHEGRCWLSGRKITPADKWDIDHKVALINGGENRESNLAPALRDRHREKTASDVAEKAKTDRIRAKHLGIHRTSGRKLQRRGFDRLRSSPDGL